MNRLKRLGIVLLLLLVAAFALAGVLSMTRGTPVEMVISEGPDAPPAVSDPLFERMFELYTGTHVGGGNKVTCPSGFHCTLACGNNACRDVDCASAASCAITCSGNNSCDAITCGGGPCTVNCSGSGTCADVDCRDACATAPRITFAKSRRAPCC
jgi:hypothetical protein